VIDELEIRWPSGAVRKFSKVKSQQILIIREGESGLNPPG